LKSLTIGGDFLSRNTGLANVELVRVSNPNPLVISFKNNGNMLHQCSGLENVIAYQKVSFIGYEHSTVLNLSEVSTYCKNVYFRKGLVLNRMTAIQGWNDNSDTSNIIISVGHTDEENSYKGGLELYNTTFLLNNTIPSAQIALDSVYVDNFSSLLAAGTYYSISFNGNIYLDNPLTCIVSTQFIDTTLTFNGNFYLNSGETSTNVIIATNLNRINFNGSVYCNLAKDGNFIAYNNSLTDIYFYDDDVTIINDSGGHIFVNNSSELTINGIAGGNVETIANQYSIPFEAIV
jgi:hypothetical protein